MIIGIDASRANRKHKTGTEWYSYYLIREFAQMDSKNEYILYADRPLEGGLADLTCNNLNCNIDKEFDENGYQIIKSPHNNFKAKILDWPFNFFWTLGRLSWEMALHSPDVLFVPAHTLPLIHPRKTITTVHDVAFKRDKMIYRQDDMGSDCHLFRKILGIIIKFFTAGKYGANSVDYLDWSTNFAIEHARKIITVSNFSKSEILEIYKSSDERIKVIYNGYNNFLYRKIDDNKRIDEVLNDYGIDKPYILYVGRLEKKKNTPRLIKAFAVAKEYNVRKDNKDFLKHKLVLIGNAGFGYDEIKYLIREFDLNNDVIMPGWIRESDMPYIYNAAEAFIFPSKYEGFGIPILQAMACGIPIVASDIPVLKEVAGDSALFFNPNDKNHIAKAIIRITEDKDLRDNLIKKGNKRVNNFSWNKCARETLEEIKKL